MRPFLAKSWLLAGLLFGLLSTAVHATGDTVQVLYAGSLTNLMERGIGPAFEQSSGQHFSGYAAGSDKIAKELRGKLRRGDVFISASPKVDDSLTGSANGDLIHWYIQFATSPLVIGYNPLSSHARQLQTQRWDTVLQTPGIRIGRTDPELDPKGALTVAMVERAQQLYQIPGLMQRILGEAENPAQVLPEETLLGRLQSGQLDAGFFYSTETSDAHIPAIPLPAELTTQANYTITILGDARNREGALRFVQFLLGPQGQALMKQHGLTMTRPSVHGDALELPASLQALLDAASAPAGKPEK
jgi:molybdate/tungstate transport system substrate-binding protein